MTSPALTAPGQLGSVNVLAGSSQELRDFIIPPGLQNGVIYLTVSATGGALDLYRVSAVGGNATTIGSEIAILHRTIPLIVSPEEYRIRLKRLRGKYRCIVRAGATPFAVFAEWQYEDPNA